MRPELERAAISGDVPALEAQLTAGADVDAKDRYGQTALMLAAHHGRLDAVKALLRHEANPDVTAKYGLSALMLAIVAGHESVARELARAGADLALRGTGAPGFAGKTAHDLAWARGMTALCEVLKDLSAAMEGRTKRLVSLPLEPDQEREILRLLDEAAIAHQEMRSKSRFFGSDAIWVAQGDYRRAKEILDREAADYAAAARETWQAEWHREHGGSYARWLWNRLRRATMEDFVRALFLVALVSLMLLYPLTLLR